MEIFLSNLSSYSINKKCFLMKIIICHCILQLMTICKGFNKYIVNITLAIFMIFNYTSHKIIIHEYLKAKSSDKHRTLFLKTSRCLCITESFMLITKCYFSISFFKRSVSMGTILWRSPTIPRSAALKIGAYLSLLIAMI